MNGPSSVAIGSVVLTAPKAQAEHSLCLLYRRSVQKITVCFDLVNSIPFLGAMADLNGPLGRAVAPATSSNGPRPPSTQPGQNHCRCATFWAELQTRKSPLEKAVRQAGAWHAQDLR